ncbi:MAG: S41 family peptidase, partial [Geodermatophilaceae bacterium]
GVPERLPYGPVNAVAAGADGAVVVGVAGNRRGAASWKRYRGGTSGKLWIDATGSGEFTPFLDRINGQLEDPAWIGGRLVFLSDHEGYGNVYSCRPDGSDLRRHTDHADFYARAAHADGARLVYQCAGELWLLPDLAAVSRPQRLDIVLGGARAGLARHAVAAADHLGAVAPDRTGRASALEVRGSVHWVAHRDGPARALAAEPGVRHRLPQVFGQPEQRAAWITDADGDDALEVSALDGAQAPHRLASGALGRVLDLAVAPDGGSAAVATHDGRVLLVDLAAGTVREVDSSPDGDAGGLAFSPDSRWLAWSHAGPEPLRQIRMCDPLAAEGTAVLEATPMRFTDTEPVFTLDGKHLALLSVRTLDPVYDALVFDLSFVGGTRPYLLPLGARTPSPFDPSPAGRPMTPDEGKAPEAAAPGAAPSAAGRPDPGTPADAAPSAGTSEPAAPAPVVPEVSVDPDAIAERLVPLPVPAGDYSSLRAAHGGLVWLSNPQLGELGDSLPGPEDRPRSSLQRYDFGSLKLTTLDERVDAVQVSGDGRWLVLRDESALRVVPADRVLPPGDEGESDRVDVDLSRVRVEIDPAAEWRQMYDENERLMRDHFWIADMGGVDWAAAVARYRPLLDRVATRDDLSELFWEVIGELGASHAYESQPPRPAARDLRLGLLGADLAPDADGVWRVTRVVPGESSAPSARAPLAAPGVAVRAGDAILAVGGRPVDPVVGPYALLVGAADTPVSLTVASADGTDRREVVVVPLPEEMPLRYQDWVVGRRAAVHAATDGRAGYLHIPDMVANGWAQFHRDIRIEVDRECLIVDVRDNNGGHVSSLVLEKLARTVQGWATVRHGRPMSYPEGARRGPIVAITDEYAGSDGDIVAAMIRQLGLGPVVGTRTWGGVIGIDGRYSLVDGTSVTQPRYSFWFGDAGWGVENYGVDPDVEVRFPPHCWARGTDPQLDAAVALVLERLAAEPASSPPSSAERPDRAAPELAPRP